MIYTLLGEIPAKKNAWKKNRYGTIYQSKQKEINDLLWQIKTQKTNNEDVMMTKNCKIIVEINGDNRKDLDGQITTICDLLQTSEVVKNDRQIKDIFASKRVGKQAKCMVQVYEL